MNIEHTDTIACCNQDLSRNIEEIFQNHKKDLSKVAELARKVEQGVRTIDPFIQQNTSIVCPQCMQVCCINRHAYYNHEDLIYLYALDLKPHGYESRGDLDPCQFLSPDGCRLERAIRPSGCNWYFCESLYDRMEKTPGSAYNEFDDSLHRLTDLWMELVDEFKKKFKKITGCELQPKDLMRTMQRTS